MKLTLEHVPGAESEIIVRYAQVDDEVAELLAVLDARQQRLHVFHEGRLLLIPPTQVLYCESVDGRVFVYTADGVYDVRLSLNDLAERFESCGFFRCAKSAVVNLNRVNALRSCTDGRMITTLANGERLLISRCYATLLRERLKDGQSN